MVGQTVRMMRTPHWIALFALVLASWLVLFAASVPADLRAAGRVYGADVLAGLCLITPDAAGFVRVAAMWAVMSVAMMAPTALHAEMRRVEAVGSFGIHCITSTSCKRSTKRIDQFISIYICHRVRMEQQPIVDE